MSRPPSPPFSDSCASAQASDTDSEHEQALGETQYPRTGDALRGSRFPKALRSRFIEMNTTMASIISNEELRAIVDRLNPNEADHINEEIVREGILAQRLAHQKAADNAISAIFENETDRLSEVSIVVSKARRIAGESSAADCAFVVFPRTAWSQLPKGFASVQQPGRTSTRTWKKPQSDTRIVSGRVLRSQTSAKRAHTLQKKNSVARKRKR